MKRSDHQEKKSEKPRRSFNPFKKKLEPNALAEKAKAMRESDDLPLRVVPKKSSPANPSAASHLRIHIDPPPNVLSKSKVKSTDLDRPQENQLDLGELRFVLRDKLHITNDDDLTEILTLANQNKSHLKNIVNVLDQLFKDNISLTKPVVIAIILQGKNAEKIKDGLIHFNALFKNKHKHKVKNKSKSKRKYKINEKTIIAIIESGIHASNLCSILVNLYNEKVPLSDKLVIALAKAADTYRARDAAAALVLLAKTKKRKLLNEMIIDAVLQAEDSKQAAKAFIKMEKEGIPLLIHYLTLIKTYSTYGHEIAEKLRSGGLSKKTIQDNPELVCAFITEAIKRQYETESDQIDQTVVVPEEKKQITTTALIPFFKRRSKPYLVSNPDLSASDADKSSQQSAKKSEPHVHNPRDKHYVPFQWKESVLTRKVQAEREPIACSTAYDADISSNISSLHCSLSPPPSPFLSRSPSARSESPSLLTAPVSPTGAQQSHDFQQNEGESPTSSIPSLVESGVQRKNNPARTFLFPDKYKHDRIRRAIASETKVEPTGNFDGGKKCNRS